ncbi:MAG: sugar phosphate isomerase/epimerase [Anaerolineaceae bacterium]|nr:sugar phosphate isomerase/epimerase [Anaerolineaceae bacterium]
MKNPVQSIRIGTMVPGSAKVGDYVAQIADYGFESFELNFWNTIPEDVDLPKIADDLFAAIGDRDIIISSVGIYGNPLQENETGARTHADWERLIDAAHYFKADVLCGFTGRVPGLSVEENLPRFKEIWTPLAEKAADKGLRIAWENCPMGGNWQTGNWNLAFNPDAWNLLFDAVPLDNLGLEWEPCHQMCQLIDPLPQLREWVGRVFHLHGKDATVLWDVVQQHGITSPETFAYHRTPGFGDTNWVDLISILRQDGFTGAIDIEGWHDPVYRDELEMTGQVYAVEYLKECRGGEFYPNPQI